MINFRSRKGFTLLEIMIAIAFVSLALVAVLQAQGQSIKLVNRARFTSRAVFLAQIIMADPAGSDTFSGETTTGNFEEPLDYLAWERKVTPIQMMPGLFKIVVRVYTDDEVGGESLSLTGMVYVAGPP